MRRAQVFINERAGLAESGEQISAALVAVLD
jgi:hypothetical protein